MSTHHNIALFARLGTFVDVFGSAVAAASAVEARRVPKVHGLGTPGIGPRAFGSIGRV